MAESLDSYQDIVVERPAEGVGLIRLSRPQALNALRTQLMGEVADALERFDHEDAIGGIVITGSDKAFSAGADVTEMAGKSAFEIRASGMIDNWRRLQAVRKPIVAAVSGWCLGGGCELALACDIIIASETAQFGQPEINLGVIPGAGATQRLTRTLGKSLAMEMVLNDRRLSAQEALQVGLVSRAVTVERYLAEAIELAGQLAARAPLAVQLGKEAVNQALEVGLRAGLDFEERLFYSLFASEDQAEGMAAFLAKRSPQWLGR